MDVAEAGKPRILQSMGISADRLHYLNKEIKHYLHSDSLISWENEEKHALSFDILHWPFLVVYNKMFVLLYIPTLLFRLVCVP